MIRYFDVEERMVIVNEDGTGFALFIDAEHLDSKLVGVGGDGGVSSSAIASGATTTTTSRRDRTIVSATTPIVG